MRTTRREIDRRDFLKRATAGAALTVAGAKSAAAASPEPAKILSYNENMEYRRLGKTNMWVSAVCLGGHWKRLIEKQSPYDLPPKEIREAFMQNRIEIVSRCIDCGMNYVDACSGPEILAYAEAVRRAKKRDQIYFGYSWHVRELRYPEWRTKEKLIEGFDRGMKEAKLDCVDVWRVSALMNTPQPDNDIDETVAAFEKVHEQGKARFFGISSHHHGFLKRLVEKWPQVSVILFPYTVESKELPKDSLFGAVKKADVGVFGIKPFASNSIFKGDSQPDSPHAEHDDELARVTLRYILGNDAITAPIPGLISTHQVDNAALAVQERRKLDLTETAKLDEARENMVAQLPQDYRWLREWEWV